MKKRVEVVTEITDESLIDLKLGSGRSKFAHTQDFRLFENRMNEYFKNSAKECSSQRKQSMIMPTFGLNKTVLLHPTKGMSKKSHLYLWKCNARLNEKIVGGVFPLSPRFSSSKLTKLYPKGHHKRINSEQNHVVFNLIKARNKDLSQYTPNVKIACLNEKATQRKAQREQVKINRKELQEKKNNTNAMHFQVKFEKFRLRLRKAEFPVIVKSWSSIYSVVGVTSVIVTRLKYKIELKKRISKQIRFLAVISLCIGKLIIKSRQIRINRLSTLMLKQASRLKAWHKRSRVNKINVILDVVEAHSLNSTFFTVVLQLKQKVIYI